MQNKNPYLNKFNHDLFDTEAPCNIKFSTISSFYYISENMNHLKKQLATLYVFFVVKF